MQRERIYIAGPMTGIPQNNVPEFELEAARIRAMGHEVVSPVEISRDYGHDPAQEVDADMRARLLTVDIDEMRFCTAIYLLDGWERSTGAFAEWAFARALGLRVYDQTPGKTWVMVGHSTDWRATIVIDILALEPAEVRQ